MTILPDVLQAAKKITNNAQPASTVVLLILRCLMESLPFHLMDLQLNPDDCPGTKSGNFRAKRRSFRQVLLRSLQLFIRQKIRQASSIRRCCEYGLSGIWGRLR
jgi:hypothetical protein